MKKYPAFFASVVLPGALMAANLVSTDFTGNSNSGDSVTGLSWVSDYAGVFTGPTSTTLTVSSGVTGGTIAGTNFTNATAGDYVSAQLNVETATGSVAGNAVWQSDYVVNYSFTDIGDSLDLTSVTLIGYARNSTGGIQSSARQVKLSAVVLDAGATTTFASGTLEQTIAANTSAGKAYAISLSGTTHLTGATLGGQNGSFILRVSADRPATETLGVFTAYDNLSLTGTYAAVPEPSTYGLLGAGACAAIAVARRRKQRA